MTGSIFDHKKRVGVLALADGTVFRGEAFGADRGLDNPVVGEVVFNTSMFGYQEILTDPSYAGQIMTFTTSHIGNVGCNDQDLESGRVYAEGVLVRALSTKQSNYRSRESFDSYLVKAGVLGIAGLDTRQLVTHLRDNGSQMGAMAVGERIDPDDLIDIAKAQGSMEGKDYVKHVSCKEPYIWTELPWSYEVNGYRQLSQEKLYSRPHVVAVDCGVKFNILRLLLQAGFRVTVVPSTYSSTKILELNPDAIFLSNGPGDPATLGYLVNVVRELVGRLPIFGICLGHQILGQVFGASTYKLKFGHRGGNHPVKDLRTGVVEITVQNHGFAVDPAKLDNDVKVSHINLNDQTVEGLDIPAQKIFSIQYHPESSPGPHDALYHFQRFFEMTVGYSGRKYA